MEREIDEKISNMGNKKIIIIGIIVVGVLIFSIEFLIGHVVEEKAKNQLYSKVEDDFEKDFEKYVNSLNQYGIEIDATYEKYYDSYASGTLYVQYNVYFTSADIDKYYTIEENSTNATKLYSIMQMIGNKVRTNNNYEYNYHYEEGDVDISLLTRKNEITINGASHKYEYDADSIFPLRCDGESIYHQSSSSNDSGSNDSGYTGAYDAKLKYSGTDGVLICISEDAMERFMTALNNGNDGTIEEMFSSGQCAYTEQGTKCNIVEKKLTKAQVKLLDGAYAGNTVWVVIEALQEE